MRGRAAFAAVAVLFALFITRALVEQPGFTDAFYHFNAAERFVSGLGLTDAYLWVYIGMPESLPAPSHLYWMPLTSLSAALGMWLFNAPGSYAAAQIPFALMYAGAACVGFWLGEQLGGTRRHAWVAGLLTLLSGFYLRFWGATDTFAPYALFGSLCLVCMGLGAAGSRPHLWYALSGALAGLAHLTRADGVLLLIVGWTVIAWPVRRVGTQRGVSLQQKTLMMVIMTAAYLLVMFPWFVRNLNAVGSPLPVGGAQGIWYREYDDLFNYPPDSSPQTLFADGLGTFLESRWQAVAGANGAILTLVTVEGLIVLTPLMLVGLWRQRKDPFVRGFWLYALGLHVAMSLIFPFPGMRGGLFHSAGALLPWWMAFGVAGLDDVIDWAASRRRWNARSAKAVFSAALLVFAALLSFSTARRVQVGTPRLYTALAEAIPLNSRVMINDPAQLYYFTGLGGVVLPNEEPPVILDIARRYGVDYALLEIYNGQLAASEKLAPLAESPPNFLVRVPLDVQGVILYAIESEAE